MSHRLISTQALAPAAFAWQPSTDDEAMGEPDEAMGEPDDENADVNPRVLAVLVVGQNDARFDAGFHRINIGKKVAIACGAVCGSSILIGGQLDGVTPTNYLELDGNVPDSVVEVYVGQDGVVAIEQLRGDGKVLVRVGTHALSVGTPVPVLVDSTLILGIETDEDSANCIIATPNDKDEFDCTTDRVAAALVEVLSPDQIRDKLVAIGRDVIAIEAAGGSDALAATLTQCYAQYYKETLVVPAPAPAPAPASPADDSEASDDDVDVLDEAREYVESLTRTEIQGQLMALGLKATGKTEELKDRLEFAVGAELAAKKAMKAVSPTCRHVSKARRSFLGIANRGLNAVDAASLEALFLAGGYSLGTASSRGVNGEGLLRVVDLTLPASLLQPSQPRPGLSRDERNERDVRQRLIARGAVATNTALFSRNDAVDYLSVEGRRPASVIQVIEGGLYADHARGRKGLDSYTLTKQYFYDIHLGNSDYEYEVPETSLEPSAPPSPQRGRRRSQAPADSDDEASPRPQRRRSPRIESQGPDSDGDDAYQARNDEESDDEDEEGDSSADERDDNYDDPLTIVRQFSPDVIANTCSLVQIDDNPSIPADLVPLSHVDANRYLRRARDQPLLVVLYEPQYKNGRGEVDWAFVR